jgi:hypothetical protein
LLYIFNPKKEISMVILKAFSKLVATAALLFGLAGAAQAVPIFDTSGTSSPGLLLRAYGFAISAPGTYQATLVDKGSPSSFEFLNLEILKGFNTKGVGLGSIDGPGTFSFFAGTAGIYTARLFGIAGGGPAGIGTFSISVVPEVETWVMLLVGFGLIVYQLRRKNKLNSPNMSFA